MKPIAILASLAVACAAAQQTFERRTALLSPRQQTSFATSPRVAVIVANATAASELETVLRRHNYTLVKLASDSGVTLEAVRNALSDAVNIVGGGAESNGTLFICAIGQGAALPADEWKALLQETGVRRNALWIDAGAGAATHLLTVALEGDARGADGGITFRDISRYVHLKTGASGSLYFDAAGEGGEDLLLGSVPFAEAEFVSVLDATPRNAMAAYRLSVALLSQKRIERFPEALFYVARAVEIEGRGALSVADRSAVTAYLEKQYVSYHGSIEGLDQLRQLAKTNSRPPPDFTIRVAHHHGETAVDPADPQIALWRDLRSVLKDGRNGPKYFDERLKDALIPGGVEKFGTRIQFFKGKLIRATPESNPTVLVLAVLGEAADATLRLDGPLAGSMPPGSGLEFAGVVRAYAQEPFMLILDAQRTSIKGWTGGGGNCKTCVNSPR